MTKQFPALASNQLVGISAPRKHIKRVLGLVLAIVAAFLFFNISSASAVEGSNFALDPFNPSEQTLRSQFEIDANPGDSFADRIILSNKSDVEREFFLYSSDAYNTEGGFYSLRLPNDQGEMPELTGVGKWTTIPLTSIKVEPGKGKIIPFTIQLPKNAPPGEHWGGIVAIPSDSVQDNSSGINITTKNALGVRIVLNVAGDQRTKISIGDINVSTGQAWASPFASTQKTKISYRISNTGNLSVTGDVSLVIRDVANRVVLRKKLPSLQVLVPGSSVKFSDELGELSPIGPLYRAEITATIDGQNFKSTGFVWVMPWLILIAIGLLLLRRLSKSRTKYLETVKQLRQERKDRQANAKNDDSPEEESAIGSRSP